MNSWLFHDVCTAAPRTRGLGFVINFFVKPVDALAASSAQSLRTPRVGKAMNRAKCPTRCQNEIEFSLEYFYDETMGFY